ncbi:unnamed protein product [Rotaria socialis]|uniref:Uncharacterized protein n=1 Tax=Rotaria socialis TaxID=392032 RepID=A0A817S642_9BILA|nr:unnamed protein product [Rotaria socialis]
MSTTDNWVKLYRWWQEHLKFHTVSSSIHNDNNILQRRPSLILFRSTNNLQSKKIKKCASFAGIAERRTHYNDFRHVHDSIRGNIPHATEMTSITICKERDRTQKSRTCNLTSDAILSNEHKLIASKSTSMYKKRNHRSRRFSLVKFESSSADSNGTKDEPKPTATSTSLNLIQKLLFRQINPKTRPYSMGISSDENTSITKIANEASTNIQTNGPTISKQYWISSSSSSSSSSKQNNRQVEEHLLASPSNKILSKSHQSDLNSYVSKRRNTTGSISFNKIVDTKSPLSGNTLKLATAVNAFNSSSNKITNDKDIFQTVEDSDLPATKQLIQTNRNVINSYNEYDWCPLDIAIMLNNIIMVQLLLQHHAEESSKLQPEESRYQSVCHQLSNLNEQNLDETIKKSSSNRLAPDDIQLRRSSPSCDRQQRHRRTSKNQQQFHQQHYLTLTQMKDNYEQAEINNLGRLHHAYIRDNEGNVAFVLINDLSSDTRTNVSPSNLKWMTMTKFFELMKESSSLTTNSCLQQIIEKLPDMIDSYYASMHSLDPGLYVAYLKMQNSVDSIRVMVNKHMPGSLPCTKIRSVANVSREEWKWLHTKNNENSTKDESSDNSLEIFKTQFFDAAKELFVMLDLPETHFSNSRIYDSQVVEIRDDLSLIILMSTADEVNILSSPSNHSLASFIYLPVYIFEVFQHLSNNYRFICQYSRISICLDFELIYAQQNQREAFSINELDETRYRLNNLLSCQQDLDDIWRLSRWLVHVINCAKDKTYSGISLQPFQSSTNLNNIKSDRSPSLKSPFNSTKYLIKQNLDSCIDIDNNIIELTFYRSLLTSNSFVPFKLKVNKLTKLNEILQIILKQQQNIFFKPNSLLNFVWVRPNEYEDIIEENLTAYEIQTRLLRFGGQIHIRLNSSSLSNSSQMLHTTLNILPSNLEINSKKPGSSVSLNI